jgi:hypothetical protein
MRVDDRVLNGLGVLTPVVRSKRSFRALLGFEPAYSQNGFAHESVNRVGVEAGMPCLRDTQCIGCHREREHIESAQRSRGAAFMFLHFCRCLKLVSPLVNDFERQL